MNFKKISLFVIGGLVLLALLIQLIPVQRTNPPVTKEIQWDSAETHQFARRACYDCHSNETVWPWYAYVAPVSWGVTDHVNHGRGHLNFSEWDKSNEKTNDIIEVVLEDQMPLGNYLPMHPEANFTPTEKAAFIEGLKTTLQNDPPISR